VAPRRGGIRENIRRLYRNWYDRSLNVMAGKRGRKGAAEKKGSVMIVESPAKADTISKYLDGKVKVIASYGHIRDLPPKIGSVVVSEDQSEIDFKWELSERGKRFVDELAELLPQTDQLYIATDPDREGEAIAWHIKDVLRERSLLREDLVLRRVEFSEISKNAVMKAVKKGRDVDDSLVDAYKARRGLDYLYGFTLSPVLWRKLPKAKSAGRVQSVALRLISEREQEREAFEKDEWFDVTATLKAVGSTDSRNFTATLTAIDNKALPAKKSFATLKDANKALDLLTTVDVVKVTKLKTRATKSRPQPPFTTATMQRSASTRLNWGVSRVMSVAQRLYEGNSWEEEGKSGGLITYMRTDSVTISKDAMWAIRSYLDETYPSGMLSPSTRRYRGRSTAQEAHEAIRPVDIRMTPEMVKGRVGDEDYSLYALIWRRTLASQMADQIGESSTATLDGKSTEGVPVRLVTTYGRILNPGYSAVWVGGQGKNHHEKDTDGATKSTSKEETEKEEQDDSSRINNSNDDLYHHHHQPLVLAEGDEANVLESQANGHESKPPPRFTEAALVKRLEELGIGRPSTYASILKTIRDRGYVELKKKQLVPSGRGRLVSAFLQSVFPNFVEYNFTAEMELNLDQVSKGILESVSILKPFNEDLRVSVENADSLGYEETYAMIDEILAPALLGTANESALSSSPASSSLSPPLSSDSEAQTSSQSNPRLCPSCGKGMLRLQVSRYGGYLGCSEYPKCNYSANLQKIFSLGREWKQTIANATKYEKFEPVVLGKDTESKKEVTLRKGPYGYYVQLGNGNSKAKPLRCSVPPEDAETITLEDAIRRLSQKKATTATRKKRKPASRAKKLER